MPATYIKVNGIYQQVDGIFNKVNGTYENIDNAFYKKTGAYEEVFVSGGGSGTDPQDDLDSIEIVNDTISSSQRHRETEFNGIFSGEPYDSNLWGNGKNKDSNDILIADCSYCVKMPIYIPWLNVNSAWLVSKGIVTSGSTASISRKAVNINQNVLSGVTPGSSSYHKPNDKLTIAVAQDVYDNLTTTLTNNTILLQSKERQIKGASLKYNDTRDPTWDTDAINLTRESSGYGGVKIIHVDPISFGSGGYAHWRIEVDVNYNLTFFHAESGLSRTIQKTVKFRTYN